MTIASVRHITVPVLLTALLAGCAAGPADEPVASADADGAYAASAALGADGRPTLYHANVRTVADLEVLLAAAHEVDGQLVVPNIAPLRLPADLDRLPIDHRKAYFFRTLLPLVVHENARVAAQRKRLLEILDPARTIPLTKGEMRFVRRLAAEYDVQLDEGWDPGITRAVLLGRVDVIPTPLALAQAAIESAWGLSRFARVGNALFGQWTYDPERPGIVPEDRPAGAEYRVETFPSIHASLRGYMRNLNTHAAYHEFRTLRYAQRQSGRPLDAEALAGTLHRYSARGENYVMELRAIMRQNQLSQFRFARLVPADEALVTRFTLETVDDGRPIALLMD